MKAWSQGNLLQPGQEVTEQEEVKGVEKQHYNSNIGHQNNVHDVESIENRQHETSNDVSVPDPKAEGEEHWQIESQKGN